MSQIAKDAGLGRESLYKIFSAGSKPRFETIMKVLDSIGVNFKLVHKKLKVPKITNCGTFQFIRESFIHIS